MKGLAAAKDLTTEAPRGLDAELEGSAWLPRMLDKARATLAGTAGRYLFGCPVDHTCMARLGIAPELVLDLAARHADDHALLGALRTHEALPEASGGRLFAGTEHGATVSVLPMSLRWSRLAGWAARPASGRLASVRLLLSRSR